MKIKDVLSTKGPEVFTIGANKTVYEAMDVLIRNKIGSLLVLNQDGKIVGIFSERDALRVCFNYKDNFTDILVGDVMTKKIIFAEPEDDVSYLESIMTNNRIRHVPIMKDKVLVGIVSIGDIVKASLSEQKTENKYLMDYFYGMMPKG